MGIRSRSGPYLKRGDITEGVTFNTYVWHRFNIFQASGSGIDSDAGYRQNEVYLVLDIVGKSPRIARVLTQQGRLAWIEANALRTVR